MTLMNVEKCVLFQKKKKKNKKIKMLRRSTFPVNTRVAALTTSWNLRFFSTTSTNSSTSIIPFKKTSSSFAATFCKAATATAAGFGIFRTTRVAFCKAVEHQKETIPDVSKYLAGGQDPQPESGDFEFDLVIIGGGSGGLAAAKRASKNGAKVALCDFVAPSPKGTVWGLGGTCVNVGCIPKKLMHTAALISETIRHGASSSYGFGAEEDSFDHKKAAKEGEKTNAELINFSWARLRQNVHDYIRGLNFSYLGDLRENDVKYFNAMATFVDKNTIKTVDKKGKEKIIKARRFIIATGGRPQPLTFPGGEHAISSDDLFFSKQVENPGKCLVVGAGYIALECAGLLHSLGFPCTVMARSVPLRVMDQQCAEVVTNDLIKRIGVNVLIKTSPTKIEKNEQTGKLSVSFKSEGGGVIMTEEFDTVIGAVGRYAESHRLNLEAVGVDVHPHTQKIMTNKFDRTSCPNIYAIGDVAHLCPELTPVAIKAGQLLANRLYKNPNEKTIDYNLVPTTVFTPLEYGFVGHSEESAFKHYGEDKIETYLTSFTPLEWSVPHWPTDACLMKLIVEKQTDKVVGFHIVSPNAGEITQGVAVAMQCGATREQFRDTVGIHPTIAEDMCNLTVTKSSGESYKKGGC